MFDGVHDGQGMLKEGFQSSFGSAFVYASDD